MYELDFRDIAAAEANYKKAVDSNPDNSLAMVSYAQLLHLKRHDIKSAQRLYESVLTTHPAYAEAWFQLGACQIDQHKYSDAEHSLQKAHRLDPSDVAILLLLSRVRQDGFDDSDGALALTNKALALEPSSACVVCAHAYNVAKYQKDYDSAIALYKKAMDTIPFHPMVPRELALMKWVLLASKSDGVASEGVTAPSSDEGQSTEFQPNADDLDQIRKLFDESLKLDPQDATTLMYYADFKQSSPLMDYQSATEMYGDALREDPDNLAAMCKFALFMMRTKDEVESDTMKMVYARRSGELLDKAAALKPHDWTIQMHVAQYKQKVAHAYEDAQKHYEIAVSLNPHDPDLLFKYAYLLHYHLRDYNKAEEAYQRCLGLPLQSLQAMLHYGLLLCNNRMRYTSARRILARVLELEPDNTDARFGYNCTFELERSKNEASIRKL